uniref:Uncharacterized protein n=1 Tax=Zea mays TaxID=4577 RepID=B4FI74_MAIZE|nr:unknown [Zea mays]
MRHAACLAVAASFIHFLVTPTRTRRIRNGGEEHELLLAVAVAAADEAVADAAPAEDGARGAALPAPARGRGRRRLPAGRPQAVALRRHALQVLVPGAAAAAGGVVLVLVLPRLRTRRSPVRLPRAELPLLQQEPAQRHPQGGRLRLLLLLLPQRGRGPAEDRVHGHDARAGGDRRNGEAELVAVLVLGLHGWRQGLRKGSGGANREGGRSGRVTLTVWDEPNQGVRRDGYGTGSFRDAGRWAASRNRDHDSVGNSEGSWGAVG